MNMRKQASAALLLALTVTVSACSAREPASTSAPPVTSVQTEAAPTSAETQTEVPTAETTAPATTQAPASEPSETTAPAPFNEGLDAIRTDMEPSGAVAGVFLMGYTEKTLEDPGFFQELSNQAALLEYPFILEIPASRYIKNEGGQVFCIVPADPEARVTVFSWNVEGDLPGDILYESETGEPILVQGNISDILPNLGITIIDSYGNALREYHPCISMEDGRVVVPQDPVVLDFTGYAQEE